jgi:hypothetical protein
VQAGGDVLLRRPVGAEAGGPRRAEQQGARPQGAARSDARGATPAPGPPPPEFVRHEDTGLSISRAMLRDGRSWRW